MAMLLTVLCHFLNSLYAHYCSPFMEIRFFFHPWRMNFRWDGHLARQHSSLDLVSYSLALFHLKLSLLTYTLLWMSNFTEVALSSAALSDRSRCFACLVWIYTTGVAILNFMRSTLANITSRSIRRKKKNMMRALNMFCELAHKGNSKKVLVRKKGGEILL